jgi:myo-inositol-1(or 4)-monophosphatase
MPEPMTVAIDAARAAGRQLIESFGAEATGVDAKSSHTDLVSDADRQSETVIVSAIRRAFPQDAIVAEEGSLERGGSGRTWYIDPLDGTINYLYGIPHWSVSIACVDERGGLVGVVFDPCRDEMFSGERGAGARVGATRLAVSEQGDLAQALIATGFAYVAEARASQALLLRTLLPAVRDIRRFGSAALDLAWLSRGRVDGYFESGVQGWDIAAGSLLVREAGGAVTEVRGIGHDRRPGLVASNGRIHEPLRALLVPP